MFEQLDRSKVSLDELQQHMRDGRLYQRTEFEGGGVMYEQLLKWSGASRMFRNGELYIEVRE